MKVVITNTQMCNGGDAAIAFALVEDLRRAFGDHLEITIIDPLPDVARRHYPEFTFLQAAHYAYDRLLRGPLRRLAKVVNAYRDHRLRAAQRRGRLSPLSATGLGHLERQAFDVYAAADLVVSTGGTYLVDNYDISGRLFELELASAAGKAPMFYTQSLGPFLKPGMAEAVLPHFLRTPAVLLRDERSETSLRRIGISPQKLHVLADGVFSLADPADLQRAATARTKIRRVGISLRSWSFFEGKQSSDGMRNYIAGVARAADWLIKAHDCEITFISTCQGIPEYWAKDSLVADRALAEMDPALAKHARVDHDFHSPFELKKILSTFDLVIATRMHMAILALCAGVPVLPIAYEFKTTELFRRLGMGSWVTPIEKVSAEGFPKTVEQFLQFLPGHREALFAFVEQERQTAIGAGAIFAAAFERQHPPNVVQSSR